MKYKVKWLNDIGTNVSEFTTWGDKVTDTSPGLRWALGKSYVNAENYIRQQGGFVILIDNSSSVQFLSNRPQMFFKPTEVTITRGSSHDGD